MTLPREKDEPMAAVQEGKRGMSVTQESDPAEWPVRSVKEFIKRYWPSAKECPHCKGTGMLRGGRNDDTPGVKVRL